MAPGGLESGGERPLHSVSPLVFYCICRPPGVFPGYGETQVHVTFLVKEERQQGRERGEGNFVRLKIWTGLGVNVYRIENYKAII